ncbi:MAG: thioredoxin family protein [Rhodothermaceae bacterium]|nr:thioredoxin family protein [Rhodothermaceae bacterium]
MRTPLTLTLLGLAALALVAVAVLPGYASSEASPTEVPVVSAEPGDTAPDFTLADTYGETHTLSDYAGEWVVLEWLNYDCPYVRKHYNSDTMQRLQEHATEQGAVWLSIVSSAPGEQGHFSNDEMNARTEAHGGHQTAVLIDEPGTVGRAYGARTTPHMFIINPDREIVYNGAIDDRPTPDPASLEGAINYVRQALHAAMNGEEVATARTQPYGCSVKYAR